jgi:hypothetical protein
LCEHGLGAFGLAQIGFILEVTPGGPQRKAMDLVTRALDGFDLAPNERMADCGIEIAQIGEAHSHSAVGWSRAVIAKARPFGEGLVWIAFSDEFVGRSDMSAGERLRDEVRLVACVQLVAEILDVPLDGARSDAELQGALFGGEAARDAFQHFALALR